jgi:hypothetical protein
LSSSDEELLELLEPLELPELLEPLDEELNGVQVGRGVLEGAGVRVG